MAMNNKPIFIFFFIISTQLIILMCSSPTKPESVAFDKITGQLEADIDHAVLESDGTIWAWGGNTTGQLGNGTMDPSATPVKVKKVKDIVAIDLLAGCAIAADIQGDIWFWGNSLLWNEGQDEIIVTEPTKIAQLSGVIALEIESSIINLLKNDGTVWQLQWDHRMPIQHLNPEKLNEMENIQQISGDLALKNNGKLCSFPGRLVLQPEDSGIVESISNITKLGNMSRNYTVILKKDSTVWAWGKGSQGVLGNSTLNDSATPVKINILDQITDISVNGVRCLALKNDGTVWFWGFAGLDQGIKIFQNFPIKIGELDNVQLIKAGGGNKNIVKKEDGSYWVFDSLNRVPVQVIFNRF